MKELFKRFLKDEDGANMVEYALLVALIGVVLIVTINLLTGGIDTAFTRATNELNSAS